MKEYVEIVEGMFGYVHIHTENEQIKTDLSWYTKNITVINKFARDGWKVVGYEKESILMERDKQDN
jgi:hypothetical protein